MVPPRLNLVPADTITNDNGPAEPASAHAEPAAEIQPAAIPGAITATQLTPSTTDASAAHERREKLRILEALLFASPEPVDESRLAAVARAGDGIEGLMQELAATYATRGVNLVRIAGKWAMRTAEDLSWVLERHSHEERRLSKAALETLAIIAYHQPVTRAEIEEIRGVSASPGTLDILLETRWVRPRGRRRAPGRPVTYGTTEAFLEHFGLDAIKDLPGLAELKGAGLLDANLPPGFSVPEPTDTARLMPDELPLDAVDEEDGQVELTLSDEDVPAEAPGTADGRDR